MNYTRYPRLAPRAAVGSHCVVCALPVPGVVVVGSRSNLLSLNHRELAGVCLKSEDRLDRDYPL